MTIIYIFLALLVHNFNVVVQLMNFPFAIQLFSDFVQV